MRSGARSIKPHLLLLCLFICGSWLSPSLGSQELPTEHRSNFYRDEPALTLAPGGARADDLVAHIETGLAALEPRIGIEVALPIPVRDHAFSAEGRIELLRILQSISTMEGIEYYSASRGEMRIFYHESYRIAGPGDRTRLPDPTPGALPRRDTIYAFQRDGSFGRNVQRIDYEIRESAILMRIENVTTMSYNLVPLVGPQALRTYIMIQQQPERGRLHFYGNLGVRVPFLFGLEERARDSFLNRVIALQQWFVGQLETADLLDPTAHG